MGGLGRGLGFDDVVVRLYFLGGFGFGVRESGI